MGTFSTVVIDSYLPQPQTNQGKQKQKKTTETKNLLTNKTQKSENINNKSKSLPNHRHLTGNNYLLLAQFNSKFNYINPVERNFRIEVIKTFIHFALKEVLESFSFF